MKVNVLLLNSIIISLISGCTFFPDVEVDDISHIESEIYNPAYTECMDDDMTKTQIFNNKNNFLVRETTDGFFLCGPIDIQQKLWYCVVLIGEVILKRVYLKMEEKESDGKKGKESHTD